MHSLFDLMAERHPGLPRVLFGHSMGSIAAGIYFARYQDAEVLVLSGTPAPNAAAGVGIALASAVVKLRGYTAQSKLLTMAANATTGGNKGDIRQRLAWLTRDEAEIDRAMADPLYGAPFSASAQGELFRALNEFGGKGWANTVPDIPILIAAGADDNCGLRGAGPKHYRDALLASGHSDVSLKLYDGARHEILNELCRDEAERDIIDFISSRIKMLSFGSDAYCEIRAAEESDIAEISELYRFCNLPPISDLSEILVRNIERKSALVALMGGRFVGVAVWSPPLRRISLIFVSPGTRGMGVAASLMQEVLAQMPPGDVYVETFHDSDPRSELALRFYARMGFRPDGDVEGYEVPMQRLVLRR
jgi:ribosomal protein S18 acetylase RimI-like enzyme